MITTLLVSVNNKRKEVPSKFMLHLCDRVRVERHLDGVNNKGKDG